MILPSPPVPITLHPNAALRPTEIARSLQPWLGPHPLMDQETGILGLVLEVRGGAAGLAQVRETVPPLAPLHAALTATPDERPETLHILAVNVYPPTTPDRFQLRPHTDRRWLAGEFGSTPPRDTLTVVLDFPVGGEGGELVVFPEGSDAALADLPRDRARHAARRLGGVLVPPQPGLACRVPGRCPHAVIGYHAPNAPTARRVVLVIATFDHGPEDPPPMGLLSAAPAPRPV